MAIFFNFCVCSGLQISYWPILALWSRCTWHLIKPECSHEYMISKGRHAVLTCLFSPQNSSFLPQVEKLVSVLASYKGLRRTPSVMFEGSQLGCSVCHADFCICWSNVECKVSVILLLVFQFVTLYSFVRWYITLPEGTDFPLSIAFSSHDFS